MLRLKGYRASWVCERHVVWYMFGVAARDVS